MDYVIVMDEVSQVDSSFREALEEEGIGVHEESIGPRVIRLLRSQRVKAVVIVLPTPDKEGFVTIREIKAWFPEVAVVALASETYYLKISEQLGADRTLPLPVTAQRLAEIIKPLIGSSENRPKTLR